MAKNMELKGMIHAKYNSESELARSIGWSRQRLYKIVSGLKEPDLEEVRILSNVLDQPFMRIANIFLQTKSPNGDN